MAMNPMQRKIRNSFLLGFLVAVIIGAVVIALLFMRVKKLKEDLTLAQQEDEVAVTYVYTLTKDVKAGENLAGDESGNGKAIDIKAIPAQSIPENALTDNNLGLYQDGLEEGSTVFDSDKPLKMNAKLDMKTGTILTTDLVEKSQETTSYRTVEYSMISLPSQLAEGDYIDLRIKYFSGEDLVILSKVHVDACTTNSISLTLSEAELLLLNNAIIESYILDGTSLYATLYKDEAQPKLTQTYAANANVTALMTKNSTGEKNKEVIQQMNSARSITRDFVDSLLKEYETEEQINKVQTGFSQEESNVQAAREALLGDMGY